MPSQSSCLWYRLCFEFCPTGPVAYFLMVGPLNEFPAEYYHFLSFVLSVCFPLTFCLLTFVCPAINISLSLSLYLPLPPYFHPLLSCCLSPPASCSLLSPKNFLTLSISISRFSPWLLGCEECIVCFGTPFVTILIYF